ncbi:TPA: hypothetical protein LSH47_004935 [Escherichia coli]|nr:hypothetical protein [Escherichia coli]HBL6879039.1 hypothetical protein [Escherichia coli]HBL6883824.1 hypothetical protein [Escherichia coli]
MKQEHNEADGDGHGLSVSVSVSRQARQGMEGAKNAYREFQEVRRADNPNQGLSGR